MLVREQVFDAGEARAGRQRKAVQESGFVPQQREIRAEFRHGGNYSVVRPFDAVPL
ncbi:hypothetical protein D3C83_123080 [compost metagenome]